MWSGTSFHAAAPFIYTVTVLHTLRFGTSLTSPRTRPDPRKVRLYCCLPACLCCSWQLPGCIVAACTCAAGSHVNSACPLQDIVVSPITSSADACAAPQHIALFGLSIGRARSRTYRCVACMRLSGSSNLTDFDPIGMLLCVSRVSCRMRSVALCDSSQGVLSAR